MWLLAATWQNMTRTNNAMLMDNDNWPVKYLIEKGLKVRQGVRRGGRERAVHFTNWPPCLVPAWRLMLPLANQQLYQDGETMLLVLWGGVQNEARPRQHTQWLAASLHSFSWPVVSPRKLEVRNCNTCLFHRAPKILASMWQQNLWYLIKGSSLSACTSFSNLILKRTFVIPYF